MLYESDAQQNQVPTKGGSQVTTANKKRRLKNQDSEHRSEKRKKDNNSVARARRRKNNRNWGARGQPLKNKKPRSKKKQKTTGATSAQSTSSLEILPRQANKDDETTTPSSSSDTEDISSQDIPVLRGYRRDEEEILRATCSQTIMPPGTTSRPAITYGEDEVRAATSFISTFPKDSSDAEEYNTCEQVERNAENDVAERGPSFPQALGMNEHLTDSNQLESFAGQLECQNIIRFFLFHAFMLELLIRILQE